MTVKLKVQELASSHISNLMSFLESIFSQNFKCFKNENRNEWKKPKDVRRILGEGFWQIFMPDACYHMVHITDQYIKSRPPNTGGSVSLGAIEVWILRIFPVYHNYRNICAK